MVSKLLYPMQFDSIRSESKDLLYLEKQAFVLESLFKLSKKNVQRLSFLIYYGLTTFSSRQTIGQEYFQLLWINDTRRNLPNKLNILFYLIVKFFKTYCLFAPNDYLKLATVAFILLDKIQLVKYFFDQRAHMSIETRASDLKLVHLSNDSEFVNNDSNRRLNQFIGATKAIELFIYILAIAKYVKKQLTKESNKRGKQPPEIQASPVSNRAVKCSICLGSIREPAAINCGHIFCWSCIQRHVKAKQQGSMCPSCRILIQPEHIILLNNL